MPFIKRLLAPCFVSATISTAAESFAVKQSLLSMTDACRPCPSELEGVQKTETLRSDSSITMADVMLNDRLQICPHISIMICICIFLEFSHHDPQRIGYCDSETVKFVEYDLPKRSRHPKRSLRFCIGGIVMGELLVHNPRHRHSKRNLKNCDRKRIRFTLAYETRSEANSSADNKFGGPSLHKDGQYLPGGPKWSI